MGHKNSGSGTVEISKIAQKPLRKVFTGSQCICPHNTTSTGIAQRNPFKYK